MSFTNFLSFIKYLFFLRTLYIGQLKKESLVKSSFSYPLPCFCGSVNISFPYIYKTSLMLKYSLLIWLEEEKEKKY